MRRITQTSTPNGQPFLMLQTYHWILKLCKLLSLDTTCTMDEFHKQTTVDNTLSSSTTFAPFIKMTHAYSSYHTALTNMLVVFRIIATTRRSMPLPEIYLRIPTHDTWLSIMWTSTNNKHPWHTPCFTLMFCFLYFVSFLAQIETYTPVLATLTFRLSPKFQMPR
jgi:hypothetical protein